MALIGREMGQIAQGMQQGLFDANRYAAEQQQNDIRQRQIAALDREEGVRKQVSALNLEDFKNDVYSSGYDEGAYRRKLGGVYAGAGMGDKALEQYGAASVFNQTEKGRMMYGLYAAHVNGDAEGVKQQIARMAKIYPNQWEADPAKIQYDPKTGDVLIPSYDKTTGQAGAMKKTNIVHAWESTLAEMAPKEAALLEKKFAYDQKLALQNAKSQQALARSIYAHPPKPLEPFADDGKAIAFKGSPTAENPTGIITMPYQQLGLDKVRAIKGLLTAAKTTPEVGPNMAALQTSLKHQAPFDSLEQGQAAIMKVTQKAEQDDAMLNLVAGIKAHDPNGQRSFRYAASLLRNGTPPAALLAAGFDPDTVQSMIGALTPAIKR